MKHTYFLSLLLVGGVGAAVGSTVSGMRAELRLAETSARLDALSYRVAERQQPEPSATGTTGRALIGSSDESEALVRTIITRLQDEMGLLPVQMLRQRQASFVELYATEEGGGSTYGTAGYLGGGYFLTVKHAVVALDEQAKRIERVKLRIGDRLVRARVVDAGRAKVEVDPGDWAIVAVDVPVDLPPLQVKLDYEFPFADPIVRMGNDYSKGIIAATGYIGQRSQGLVTSLTDGHPGVSGGGVMNQRGELVGIPVGRLQGDYRFSFILPLRAEMFRKVPAEVFAGPAAE